MIMLQTADESSGISGFARPDIRITVELQVICWISTCCAERAVVKTLRQNPLELMLKKRSLLCK